MQRLEVTVDDVAAGGDGIAHDSDGRVVFVRGAIPGDTVLAELREDRPRMAKAVVVEVIDASDDRVGPPCPHVADGCGGCGWQHVAVDTQRRLKIRIVEEALRRIGRMAGTVEFGPALPAVGFRTTVRCLVVDGRAAFRAALSHDPVLIDHCLVAHPAIDELIGSARFGAATEVTLRVGARTSDRLALFEPSVDPVAALPDDVRVIGADDLGSGRRAWFTDRVCDRSFRISAESFFQTRTDGADALVEAVRSAGGDRWGSGRLLDLYGGV
ncbi:MAG: class I SAM-dependent RNA methyltransferase, partial [Acidimicrobiales bacterium]